MAYRLNYSDYPTSEGPPDPLRWVGPPGPPGPPGPVGPPGGEGAIISVLDHGAKGDGVTNDYSAIQSVLNTTGGKATIFIPDTGQPYMTDPLSVPSGTDLLIHGTVKLRAGAANSLVNFNSASNVSIRGHGILDGNAAAQSVVGAGTLGGDSASNVQIEGLTLQNAYDWNINITRSSNVKIDRVTVSGGTASNQFANGCDNCWITNSIISGPSSDGAWTFYGGVTNSGMTGCVVKNGFAGGIGIYADAPQPAACANITIADNIIYNNRTGGISVVSAGVPAIHSGIIISGNRCYANNNVVNQQYADVWIAQAVGVTISGNDVSGSGAGSDATWGVFVGNASSHVNITGNTIWNEGLGGTAGSGVYIQAANDVLVEANHFYDSQTTHTMSSAVTGNAGARNTITGNLFGTLGGTPITLVTASDTVINVGGMLPLVGGTLTGELMVNATGIGYNGSNAFAFTWTGTEAQVHIDGGVVGYMLTDSYVATHSLTLQSLIITAPPGVPTLTVNAGNTQPTADYTYNQFLNAVNYTANATGGDSLGLVSYMAVSANGHSVLGTASQHTTAIYGDGYLANDGNAASLVDTVNGGMFVSGNAGPGTVTNAIDVRGHEDYNTGGGHITNHYFLYQPPSTAATNEYSAYLSAPVGIGTNAPVYNLEVRGAGSGGHLTGNWARIGDLTTGMFIITSGGSSIYPGFNPGAGGFGCQDLVVGFNGAPNTLTATVGFLYISSCAGTPTGVPSAAAIGRVAMTYDTTNHKLWMYDGTAWRGVVLT